jgi:hypothetical protein
VLARARGASDEHRLGDDRTPRFQRTVRPFLDREVRKSSFVVGRKRGLKTKSGIQIGLERPVGCCLGRIAAAGSGFSGLLADGLRWVVRGGLEVEPPRRVFRIVKVE